ncbi:tail fiber assembly protein [Xenorhabdus szentirmaii]|uniref:tail fiber assembly protein n=1 Tax=Xenorhabdus szentirmaii TaxID=290112 RepID=UPI002B40D22A|nr:tail fiber assembly protein [Xenorhabdus sp. ZM]
MNKVERTIYVLTRDYRSYTEGAKPVEPYIEVTVPSDFSGGMKTYSPDIDEWISDEYVSPSPDYVGAAKVEKQYQMSQVNEKIAPLQDASDLEIASEEEKQALAAWRRYRVMLNRVDCSHAPDIEWPEQPE